YGLAGLLGGGGGGLATKTICHFFADDGPKNIFPCYEPDSNGGCRIARYASKTKLPMVGVPEVFNQDIECFRYKNESYIVIPTSIPEQVQDSVFHFPTQAKCYSDSLNCGNIKSDTLPHEGLPKPYSHKYFYSCKYAAATTEGCPIAEKGLSLVFDETGKLKHWKRDGLLLYLEMKAENNVTKFMNRVEQEGKRYQSYKLISPWHFYDNDATNIIEKSIHKASGMQFFSGIKKSERKDLHFNTMQEAIKTCKEWIPLKTNQNGGGK
ncbi:MAG: hypothetical protein VZR14_09835, partial [Hallerella sp.]|nr:hypothetical protein [Hallerella sp.]